MTIHISTHNFEPLNFEPLNIEPSTSSTNQLSASISTTCPAKGVDQHISKSAHYTIYTY
jgi:hypothetical protein